MHACSYTAYANAACMLTPVRRSVVPQGPMDRVYKAALALGTANQLTNILRDVGEDIRERNRIYVPMQELAQFNITEEEVSMCWVCASS